MSYFNDDELTKGLGQYVLTMSAFATSKLVPIERRVGAIIALYDVVRSLIIVLQSVFITLQDEPEMPEELKKAHIAVAKSVRDMGKVMYNGAPPDTSAFDSFINTLQ